MPVKSTRFACGAVLCVLSIVAFSRADEPESDPAEPAPAEPPHGQEMLELPVRVVDPDGVRVVNAKVTPWALRSSQGHGQWREDDERAGIGPQPVLTDNDGRAVVLYPLFRDLQERTRTTAVSLLVDHPDFAYVDSLHIDVPWEIELPYEIKLTPGMPVDVRPLVDGQPADLDNLFAVWSDGRSWRPGAGPEKLADGRLRIPAMRPGNNSVLLVKLEGDRATHFSDIVDFELQAGKAKEIDAPLRSALRIEGELSDSVPRPVRNGRIKVWTLPPEPGVYDRVQWFTWTPVRADGTFTIDAWPAGERLQLIALCDGYIAASGEPPDVVDNPGPSGHLRPQVFEPVEGERIEVAMTPLVRCVATTLDKAEKPVAGVTVASWPNVGWWNGGSQIYCHPLVRGERLLGTRDYQSAVDEAFPQPFQGETDADGKVTLELPAGSESLAVSSDVYELPVLFGRRYVPVELTRGEVTEVVLRLQPRGTDQLGEWERLADAHPAVRQEVNDILRRFRAVDNQPTPKMLTEAYLLLGDAFLKAGDEQEAAKWFQKAAEQAAKAEESE